MKKYNYQDDFEMVYLRHEYIEKIEDPEKVDIKKFKHIAERTARLMYDKYKPNFEKVGFDVDDAISIASMYHLAYMGLYSVRVNEGAMERFVNFYKNKHGEDKSPSEEAIDKKDRNNLINFLGQRFHHCNTVCGRKSRNILVSRDFSGAFAKTEKSKPASNEEIMANYKKFGYRKVTHKELKEIKAEKKKSGIKELYDKDGFPVIEIEVLSKGLISIDGLNPDKDYDGYRAIGNSAYEDFYGQGNGKYHSDPESVCVEKEERNERIRNKSAFYKFDKEDKIKKLKFFIRKNRGNPLMKKELTLAKKFIASLNDVGYIEDTLKKYGEREEIYTKKAKKRGKIIE